MIELDQIAVCAAISSPDTTGEARVVQPMKDVSTHRNLLQQQLQFNINFCLPVNFPLMVTVGAGLAIHLVGIQRMTTKPAPTGSANQ